MLLPHQAGSFMAEWRPLMPQNEMPDSPVAHRVLPSLWPEASPSRRSLFGHEDEEGISAGEQATEVTPTSRFSAGEAAGFALIAAALIGIPLGGILGWAGSRGKTVPTWTGAGIAAGAVGGLAYAKLKPAEKAKPA